MSFFDQRHNHTSAHGIPEGQVIGSFAQYSDAQKVVDHLSDQQCDIQAVAIMGHDLRSVEQVTGRLSYPKVAVVSAIQGAMFGVFIGVILALFGDGDWGISLLMTALLGAAFWMIMGVVSFAAQRGRRDFTSVSTVVAARYDVVVRPDAVASARQALRGLEMPGLRGGNHQRPQTQNASTHDTPQDSAHQPKPESTTAPTGERDLPDGRPRYGVRIDPRSENPSTEPDTTAQS